MITDYPQPAKAEYINLRPICRVISLYPIHNHRGIYILEFFRLLPARIRDFPNCEGSPRLPNAHNPPKGTISSPKRVICHLLYVSSRCSWASAEETLRPEDRHRSFHSFLTSTKSESSFPLAIISNSEGHDIFSSPDTPTDNPIIHNDGSKVHSPSH